MGQRWTHGHMRCGALPAYSSLAIIGSYARELTRHRLVTSTGIHSGSDEGQQRVVVAAVGGTERLDVGSTRLAGDREVGASPPEWVPAPADEQQVGHLACEPTVAVTERMNPDQPVVKPRRSLFQWHDGVVCEPVLGVLDEVAKFD